MTHPGGYGGQSAWHHVEMISFDSTTICSHERLATVRGRARALLPESKFVDVVQSKHRLLRVEGVLSVVPSQLL